jgi:hypothetical protein
MIQERGEYCQEQLLYIIQNSRQHLFVLIHTSHGPQECPSQLHKEKLFTQGSYLNLNSAVGSDEEPQDLDEERHEDFEGHILGSYVQNLSRRPGWQA